MKISAVILAAGASERMGQTKALLDYRGETFVCRLRRVLKSYCAEVIVVGAKDSEFAVDVVNPAPERGMLSSLQCGLRAVAPDSDAVMFTLVDLPAIRSATVGRLAKGWRGELLRIPRHQGHRGHPVLMARELIPEFLAAEGTPRDVIARHEDRIVYVNVEDAGVLMDVDDPGAYQKLNEHG